MNLLSLSYSRCKLGLYDRHQLCISLAFFYASLETTWAAFIMYYLGRGEEDFLGGIQKFSGQNWGDRKFSTDF